MINVNNLLSDSKFLISFSTRISCPLGRQPSFVESQYLFATGITWIVVIKCDLSNKLLIPSSFYFHNCQFINIHFCDLEGTRSSYPKLLDYYERPGVQGVGILF